MSAAPKTDFARLLPPLLERAREGDRHAEEEVVHLCWPLARHIARKRYCPGKEPEREDLEQVCLIGLVMAVRGYQPGGAAFTTYAHRVMWNACTRAQMQAKLLGYRTTDEQCLVHVVSLDCLVRDEDGDSERLEERLQASNNAEDAALLGFSASELRAWMAQELVGDSRYLRVLELRYGLNGDVPRTFEEIGEILGMTKMGVNLLFKRAIRRLRKSGYARVIWSGVENE